ncbi:MAG: hypothetical protein KJO41_07475 [Bacteroidia bacterium]|nr:hypothetical protein [Bacteroidia bacterium]MBT8278826.1 hypothetical protein [Bacteroidia bacterium]NND26871.1 hypothetical protein [Flavobacteriaceae bacterium]NNK60728.1 hypothetical protein [Flavobacteriaceae bacterium]NNL34036.1 hypothetical protein [Flavobacteriaceae bacterium]
MKTFVIGSLLFLGLTTLSFSQNGTNIKEEKLDDVVVTPLNLTYTKFVQDENTPEKARLLENQAARFDVTELEIFDNSFEAYEVIFRKNEGSIIATYDKNGKIIQSTERFENVVLPASVRNKILTEYPGWAIQKDVYLVSYFEGRESTKTFKVQIKNGSKRKNLKIDSQGNMK